jgi:protein SCO1
VKKTVHVGLGTLTAVIVSFLGNPVRADQPRYRRSVQTYPIPDVVLINQDGAKVPLKTLMTTGKPVLLDFIYGTCTTICPILSAGYANLQRKLGPDSGEVQLVSVSIDPEHDTPKVMRDYLARYRAKPGWDFLTGSRTDIDRVMRAFDAYVPDKMSHYQLTLIRVPKDGGWVRLSGLTSSAELMAEYAKAKQQ